MEKIEAIREWCIEKVINTHLQIKQLEPNLDKELNLTNIIAYAEALEKYITDGTDSKEPADAFNKLVFHGK